MLKRVFGRKQGGSWSQGIGVICIEMVEYNGIFSQFIKKRGCLAFIPIETGMSGIKGIKNDIDYVQVSNLISKFLQGIVLSRNNILFRFL